ncbi:MAG TPA: exodeoxyribonuclease V subunit alpha [Acidimicrobiia bacterium]|nr:exodeoxyribonuclease V subunit alpha [Acidimicrobiia bacterium]
MSDRIRQAASSANAVIDTDGLLAAFNDAGVLHPLDVSAAQTIARLHGETDDRVLLAAALAVRGTRFGHVCVRIDDLRDAVVVDWQDPDAVDLLPWPDPVEWQAAVDSSALVGNGEGHHPLVEVDDRLYLERYFRYEQLVAELLVTRSGVAAREIDPAVGEAVDRLLDPGSGQRTAARQALNGRLAVIAGGPGTGKTYTIGALLVALAAAGEFPLVAVCAPTGKAAARLGEAITQQAADTGDARVAETLAQVRPSTIHRLLGWTWRRGRFERDATNRLPHDLVIVDEMSMVSLPLAAKLLAAVRDDATVVMVGDPFQLESIEAGTVLADIVDPATRADSPDSPLRPRVVVLERGYRFEEDSTIADFADSVRRGAADPALELLAAGGDTLHWVPDRSSPGFLDLWHEVVSSRVRLVDAARSSDLDQSLQALAELAVLCARREGPSGVSRWGREIEEALDERYPGLRWRGEWYPGRPVMITRNDYNLDLYNGDIGVTVETDEGNRAAFERGETRTYPLSHLTEHTTVHAMTIHKSQGSQFEQVVVVLPDEESRLLTRELLYTAVTRARHRVWLVGSEAVVREAISRSVQRASGLGPLLWGTH